MRIVIYESSSFGGCFEYVKFIFDAYKNHKAVDQCKLIVPLNSPIAGEDILKILISDNISLKSKILRRLHFIYRNFANPFRLFFFLLSQPKSFVILNDFEQLTAPFWAPFYKIFLRKHTFSVFLHDPDRDTYPPSKKYSEFCMGKMMGLMDFAFYHEFLPDKKYYQNNKTKYLSVPHGAYPLALPDEILYGKLQSQKLGFTYISIIGNIRPEKNYDLAIKALKNFPDVKLVIAGFPSNSGINTKGYKNLAMEVAVHDQLIWVEKFLSDEELAAVITLSDIILLNYSKTFTSQSGILNLISQYKKTIVVSNAESSLATIVKKFNIGVMVEPDNLSSLIKGLNQAIKEKDNMNNNWKEFLSYSSWTHQIELVMREVTK